MTRVIEDEEEEAEFEGNEKGMSGGTLVRGKDAC
jgi:hypothetical protein